jgi:hypothetical protein
VGLCAAPAAVRAQLQTLALTGDPAPGVEPGRRFVGLFPSGLDFGGRVAVLGIVDGSAVDDFGLWRSDAGPGVLLEIVAREHEGPATRFLKQFQRPVVGAGAGWVSRVFYRGTVPQNADSAIVVWLAAGAARDVLVEGSQAPGFEAGARVDDLFAPEPVWIGQSARVAFFGAAVVGSGGVTQKNDSALWRCDAQGECTLVLREGQTPPGAPEGTRLDALDSSRASHVADQPAIAARLVVGVGGVTSKDDEILLGPGADWGAATLWAREGEPAAGGVIESFGLPAHAGGAVFVPARLRVEPGGVTPEDAGVVLRFDAAGAPAVVVARQGFPAPGVPGAVLDAPPDRVLVSVDLLGETRVAFLAPMRVGIGGVTTENRWALFEIRGDAATVLARQGEGAPGVPGATLGVPEPSIALGPTGDVCVIWGLAGPSVDSSNDRALLFIPADGPASVVCVEGETVPGLAAPARTIDLIDPLEASSFGDGLSGSLNGSRQLAVRLAFTDRSHGVFRVQLPARVSAPSCLSFSAHPGGGTFEPGETVVLSAVVDGPGPVEYRWRRNGMDLADDGRVSGSAEATLVIQNAGTTDSGGYQVFASGSCAAILSTPAFVEVPGCAADFNHDGQADFFDYLDFVAALDAEDPRGDFNADGQTDFFDYLDFAAVYELGCP